MHIVAAINRLRLLAMSMSPRVPFHFRWLPSCFAGYFW